MLSSSQNYRSFLSEELVRRIRSNASYSQRSFARHLGVSPGELSEVLRGKRPLSLKSALRIAQGLGLSAEETKRLVMMVQQEKSRDFDDASLAPLLDDADLNARTKQLSLDVFAVISDWYHFAILSLAECEHFKWEPKWIAARLGIAATEARVALDRLQRVGLVSKVNGRLRTTGENLATPDGVPSEAIRNYHKSILEKAVHALEHQPVAEREISGISVAISRRSLPDFKKDVSRFLDEMGLKYGSSSKKQEVYQLETALFRLTRGERE
jgi:uncharacterized protein (TIGR02147 family)